MVWDETIFENIFLSYIYVCVIRVEGYVTFLYEGSMYVYSIHIYYVYVEVYINLQVDEMKKFKFFRIFNLWM